MVADVQHLFAKAACTGCKQDLPINQFKVDRTKPRGRSTRCKDCSKEAEAVRHAANLLHRNEAIEQGHAKSCRTCSWIKPISDFPAAPSNVGGSSNECLSCFQVRHATWRMDNSEHVRKVGRATGRRLRANGDRKKQAGVMRAFRLKKQYGLTPSDVLAMREAQGGKCLICSVEFSKESWGPTAAGVDHNHETGAVRGLLCTKCNRGLGLFCDSHDLLLSAAAYLAIHSQEKKNGHGN